MMILRPLRSLMAFFGARGCRRDQAAASSSHLFFFVFSFSSVTVKHDYNIITQCCSDPQTEVLLA